LPHIDTLRVLSCVSVIAVHAVGVPYPTDSVGLGQATLLLHYSREIFLFVSALVLVHAYAPQADAGGRLPDEMKFRRRRLWLIGLPYLCWTSLYYLEFLLRGGDSRPLKRVLPNLPGHWMELVVTGTGEYHLYFLLITLQYTMVFPWILWLLRRAHRYHTLLLTSSLTAQIAILCGYQWLGLPGGPWRAVLGEASLPAYQFWLLAGAVAGLHLPRWHRWLITHRYTVLALLPVSASVLLWTYHLQLPARGTLGASSALQPVMIMWATNTLAALYLTSVWISQRMPSAVQKRISALAALSFGIYLAHPMMLDLVIAALRMTGLMAPRVWVALMCLALTIPLTVALCAILNRTRFSLALIGRPTHPAPAPATPRPVRPARSGLTGPRTPRPRRRLAAALSLAATAVCLSALESDQTSATENGTPTWEEIIEASAVIPELSAPQNPDNLLIRLHPIPTGHPRPPRVGLLPEP
jgi:peptidoglycan/LPS O-acetylase OafA/YrhL